MKKTIFHVCIQGVFALFGMLQADIATAADNYGPDTPPEERSKLKIGDTFVLGGKLIRIENPADLPKYYIERKGGPWVRVSHKPGCIRNPSLGLTDDYKPLSTPDCRDHVPGPFFVYPDAPPFQYPPAKPQTHGLDLTVIDISTSKAYFKWLCENEAGDWIYKKVDNVEGLFAMRNRPTADWGWEMFDRYYLEDPWGQVMNSPLNTLYPYGEGNPRHMGVDSITNVNDLLLPMIGNIYTGTEAYAFQRGYEFFERPLTDAEKKKFPGYQYGRYQRQWPQPAMYVSDMKDIKTAGGPNQMRLRAMRAPGEAWVLGLQADTVRLTTPKLVPTNTISSRFGFFWRGIERTPQDRRLSIAGTEEFIIDMKTNEILSLKRMFIRANYIFRGTEVFSEKEHHGVSWNYAEKCAIGDRRIYKDVLIPADALKARGIDLHAAPGPEEYFQSKPSPD